MTRTQRIALTVQASARRPLATLSKSGLPSYTLQTVNIISIMVCPQNANVGSEVHAGKQLDTLLKQTTAPSLLPHLQPLMAFLQDGFLFKHSSGMNFLFIVSTVDKRLSRAVLLLPRMISTDAASFCCSSLQRLMILEHNK